MSSDYLGKEISIESEKDIVKVRNAVYKISEKVGLNPFNRTKVATAASELARNIIEYAGNGKVIIIPLVTGNSGIQIIARDKGPGIAHVEEILSGEYQSETGMGMGLMGAKRLSDEFNIETSSEGTNVFMTKYK